MTKGKQTMNKTQDKLMQIMRNQVNQETERNSDGTFKKGNSGNPAGRPKRSDLEKAVLAEIYKLAPQAVSSLKKLLEDEEVPPNIRLRAVEIVINRICGTALNADALEEYEDKIRLDFSGGKVSGMDFAETILQIMK